MDIHDALELEQELKDHRRWTYPDRAKALAAYLDVDEQDLDEHGDHPAFYSYDGRVFFVSLILNIHEITNEANENHRQQLYRKGLRS